MNQNKRFDITWKKVHKSTFMYGSKLKFNNNFVSMDNSLMPSGMVIHEWNMLSSYTTNKQVPSLPLLKKGAIIKLSLIMMSSLKNQCILKLFYIKRMVKN